MQIVTAVLLIRAVCGCSWFAQLLVGAKPRPAQCSSDHTRTGMMLHCLQSFLWPAVYIITFTAASSTASSATTRQCVQSSCCSLSQLVVAGCLWRPILVATCSGCQLNHPLCSHNRTCTTRLSPKNGISNCSQAASPDSGPCGIEFRQP